MTRRRKKSILYVISGTALFAFFSYLVVSPGMSIVNLKYNQVNALFMTYTLAAILMLAMLWLIFRVKDQDMTFKMSRTLGFWFVNLPFASIITFSLTALVWPSTIKYFNPWIRSALPTFIMFISVISIYARALKSRDKRDIERINIMGNTSQRQITLAVLFTLITNIIIASEDWWGVGMTNHTAYSILLGTYVFIVFIFYVRNIYKIMFKKYDNLMFGWVDPILPEITFSLIAYYLLYTILIATIPNSFSSALLMMLVLGSVGIIIFGGIIVFYVLFKVSIIKYIKKLPFIHEVLDVLEIDDIDEMHATEVDHSLILTSYYKYKKELDLSHKRREKDKKDREWLTNWWRKEFEKRKRA